MSRVPLPLPRLRALAVGVALAATLPAAAADAHWNEPMPGPSPLNAYDVNPPNGNTPNVGDVEVATIGGKVHAAWLEWDGTNFEARVARLDGSTWTPLGAGPSPINRDPGRRATGIDIAELGGKPVVAWVEEDGAGVSRLNVATFDAATNGWDELLGGAPVTPADGSSAWSSALGVAEGKPFAGSGLFTPGVGGPWANISTPNGAGTAWTTSQLLTGQGSQISDIEIASDGSPLAVSANTILSASTVLRRSPGGTWTTLPSTAAGSVRELNFGVAVYKGDVYAALGTSPTGYQGSWSGQVKRFAAGGSAWTIVGGAAFTSSPTLGLLTGALTVTSSGVFVGWTETRPGTRETEIQVSWYRPSVGWVELGEPLNVVSPVTSASGPDQPVVSLDLTTLDGSPYAGFAEFDGTRYQVRVVRYGDDPAPAPKPPVTQPGGPQPVAPEGPKQDAGPSGTEGGGTGA
ncbi:MAG TPA: hypothetical protein VN238_02590, partial [Solirubrobacteraceae bacterium]|nr:hypothetical protein [Solirubrobacteraceae bacterium]